MNTPDFLLNALSSMPLELLAASERLWPDPSMAPDVPTSTLLKPLLAKEPSDWPNADLREQILHSPNCLRQLLSLSQATSPASAFDPDAIAKVLSEVKWKTQPDQPILQDTPPQRGFLHLEPGVICTLRHNYLCERGDRMATAWNFSPPTVLIVQEPTRTGDGIPYLRGIVCSHADEWPEDWLGADEIAFEGQSGNQWVLHLWLSFPIALRDVAGIYDQAAEDQHDRISIAIEAHTQDLPLQPSDGAGLGPEPDDTEVLMARDQLYEAASTLPSTLDCYLAELERNQEGQARTASFMQNLPEPLRLPAAAASSSMVPILHIDPHPATDTIADAWAEPLTFDPHATRPGQWSASFKLHGVNATPGIPFYLSTIDNPTLQLAGGFLNESGAIATLSWTAHYDELAKDDALKQLLLVLMDT